MKTFVFFIGGTGARVLRSLTMLMASGVSLQKDGDSIVPILVDYDAGNADLKRTNSLLGSYNELHAICDYSKDKFEGGFFKFPLGLEENGHYKEFGTLAKMTFDDNNGTFGKFIGYESIDGISKQSKATKLLLDTLFDTSSSTCRDREINLELKYGFKGNPNIGSVVFNEYFNSEQFKEFKNNFSVGDRIFIVGSIFGGTGSSGLPQIVKKVRENVTSTLADDGSIKAIREAMLGACVVLPYFKVRESDESAVNSLTFKSKAKAALNYYYNEINNNLSEIFYIGCEQQDGYYENVEGGEKQENKAHIIELLSAMSIIEFANHETMHIDERTKYYEYTSVGAKLKERVSNDNKQSSSCVSEELANPSFLDLLSRPSGNYVYQQYVKKLNAFAMLCKYFKDYTRCECKKGWLSPRSSYYKNLEDFLAPGKDFSEKLYAFVSKFIEWSDELNDNQIFKFNPYNFLAKELYELIKVDDSNKYKKQDFNGEITRVLNNECSRENSKDSDGGKTFLRHSYTACFEAVSKLN